MSKRKEFDQIKIIETLMDWHTQPCRAHNQWFKFGPMQVYMRRGLRSVGGDLVTTLDIANIEVDAKERGKGLFGKLLDMVDVVCHTVGTRMIYVESVLNDRFGEYLKRNNFTLVPNSIPPSYYREVKL